MKNLKQIVACLLMVVFLLPVSFTYAKGPKVPYYQAGVTAEQNIVPVQYVSVEQIKESLKGQMPIDVSFDIDDTLLYSSQYFQYGKTYITPGSFDFLKDQKFWDYVAEMGDEDSVPKEAAKQLIKMHLDRGDRVHFITGRTRGSQYKDGEIDKTAKALALDFNLPNPIPVIYTNNTPIAPYKYDKSYYINKVNSKIHYGDSDEDVLAAREVGIRPIRLFRAPNSTNMPIPMAGGYGEEVLINSAF